MTKREIGDEAESARFGLGGREDWFAMLGRMNLTRDGQLISHRSRN